MRTVRDPRQTRLFDPFDPVLTPRTRQALLQDWPGVFRHVILALMPVDVLGGAFDPRMGRPTKELYSMAGLLVIKAFMNWTEEEAVTAYRFRLDVHYALNLDPKAQDLSVRTLERYARLFVEHDLAGRVMHEVTETLVRECGIRVDQQRLDSTHVFSDMASFGRTRMMGVTVKRFLTQLKRHDRLAYQALDEALRQRYAPAVHQLFGGRGQDAPQRRRQRQQVAEDMYALIRRFADDPRHAQRPTYKMLEQVFYEQCQVQEEQVTVIAKTGGRVVQNPSDPEATYDGHKGPGYQVQIAETCHPANEVQLISAALPQTAADSDTAALPQVLDQLEESKRLPGSLLADALYGSDENVEEAARRGVELVAPTREGARQADATDDALSLDDFLIDEATETVQQCPAGHAPQASVFDPRRGQTTTTMAAQVCSSCALRARCPVRRGRKGYRLKHTAKQRRLATRRREEQTPAFRQRYRLRSGIEATHSGIKRRTGLGRLRVRGQPRVFSETLLRLAGWNILRASVCTILRRRVAARAKTAFAGACFAHFSALIRHQAFPVRLFHNPSGCRAARAMAFFRPAARALLQPSHF